mgnify:CR=1 FL=1
MGRVKAKLRKWCDGVLRAVYPVHCPVCDELVDEPGEKICAECLGKIKLLTPPWCMRCGRKVQEGEEYCRDCREKRHAFDRGRALYEYTDAAAAIYRFKYAGRREYFLLCTSNICHTVIKWYEDLSRRLGIPVYPKMLVRVRNTVPQKKLNPQERQNNLKKAFNIGRNDVKLKVILVFDDIYTTGSTIDEAARALREAGAEKIYFITLACGAGI